jgi:dynein heavy chain, axonemal
MLLSEGYLSARTLAKKMTKLYSLAQGQLSKQHHYDWGLRALKSALVVAGRLKREQPDKDENELLMRALYDMNAPKFIFEDAPLFADLLNDLFVSLKMEKKEYPRFQREIEVRIACFSFIALCNICTRVGIAVWRRMQTPQHSSMLLRLGVLRLLRFRLF